jgi:hypothetical protein
VTLRLTVLIECMVVNIANVVLKEVGIVTVSVWTISEFKSLSWEVMIIVSRAWGSVTTWTPVIVSCIFLVEMIKEGKTAVKVSVVRIVVRESTGRVDSSVGLGPSGIPGGDSGAMDSEMTVG